MDLLAEQRQNVRVVLLGHLYLREQASVQLERRGQVVQRLFEVAVFQVSIAQLGVRRDQHEQILFVDVH